MGSDWAAGQGHHPPPPLPSRAEFNPRDEACLLSSVGSGDAFSGTWL